MHDVQSQILWQHASNIKDLPSLLLETLAPNSIGVAYLRWYRLCIICSITSLSFIVNDSLQVLNHVHMTVFGIYLRQISCRCFYTYLMIYRPNPSLKNLAQKQTYKLAKGVALRRSPVPHCVRVIFEWNPGKIDHKSRHPNIDNHRFWYKHYGVPSVTLPRVRILSTILNLVQCSTQGRHQCQARKGTEMSCWMGC